MENFDFKNYIIGKGFSNEHHPYTDSYENDNGWIIYFALSPDDYNKEMLIVFDRADGSAYIVNVPNSEKEALSILVDGGIIDV